MGLVRTFGVEIGRPEAAVLGDDTGKVGARMGCLKAERGFRLGVGTVCPGEGLEQRSNQQTDIGFGEKVAVERIGQVAHWACGAS